MKKMFCVLVAGLGLLSFGFCSTLQAQSATDNLGDVYQDTQSFDGGPGSTINTEPVNVSPVGEVPEIGESGPVYGGDE